MAGDPPVRQPADPYIPTTAAQAAARGAAGLRGRPTPSEVIAGLRATSHGEDLIQVLSPEGSFTPNDDFPIEVSAELLRGLYRDMVLVRRFDREGNALQRQGQLSIWVPLLGQEAAQIGAGRALRPKDMAFPSYREHGVAWCRGVDPTQLLGIFRGTDHCGWDPKSTRFNSYTIVIGNQVLNATGYAMGQRFDGVIGSVSAVGGEGGDDVSDTNEATIAFFGDGATSQGDVHEGMVFAAAFDAPVVFYCQNNQWAISEPVSKQSRVPLWERSTGYGFPGVRVDGNDVLACLAVTRWALEECRSGNGPVMIEAFTYRMDAHTTSDDPTRYRMAAEEEHWKLLDPIQRVKVHLSRQGMADQDFFDAVEAEADELAARFRAHCIAMEKPPPERIFANVYTEPHAQLRDQHQEYLRYLAGFAHQDADLQDADHQDADHEDVAR
jgi:2-oxoisovalerate dehydrogenase E1 component alpha subunit